MLFQGTTKLSRKIVKYNFSDVLKGLLKMTVAQTHTIPLNNVNNKILQFILESCDDIRKIFIDVTPLSMNV